MAAISPPISRVWLSGRGISVRSGDESEDSATTSLSNQLYRIPCHRYNMFFLTQSRAEGRAEGHRVFGAKCQLIGMQPQLVLS